MLRFRYLIIILLLFPLLIPSSKAKSNLPVIDGVVSKDEWPVAKKQLIRMDFGLNIELTTLFSDTDIYFLAEVPHNAADDVIIRDPNKGRHDFFGIEFDNNNDNAIMGVEDSPDDMVLVDYAKPGAIDMFSYSFTVFEDAKYNGRNDVSGKSSDSNGTIYYEIRKSLNSKDIAGFDVSLQTGDKFYIMLAFWDDKNVGDAVAFVNIQIGNSLFLEMTVADIVQTQIPNLASATILFSGAILTVLLVYLKNRK